MFTVLTRICTSITAHCGKYFTSSHVLPTLRSDSHAAELASAYETKSVHNSLLIMSSLNSRLIAITQQRPWAMTRTITLYQGENLSWPIF